MVGTFARCVGRGGESGHVTTHHIPWIEIRWQNTGGDKNRLVCGGGGECRPSEKFSNLISKICQPK